MNEFVLSLIENTHTSIHWFSNFQTGRKY